MATYLPTPTELAALSACASQLARWADCFFDGDTDSIAQIEWTIDRLVTAVDAGVDLEWGWDNGLRLPRVVALASPLLAYLYARDIDRCARDDTRAAALAAPMPAYQYAMYIDRCARDDTRAAALAAPMPAYQYAMYVDKCPREDTRAASLAAPIRAYQYAMYVDKCPREDTRAASRASEYYDRKYTLYMGFEVWPDQ